MTGIKHFELTIFVAAVKDKIATVLKGQPLVINATWACVPAPCILTAILHDDGLQLFADIGNLTVAIGKLKRYLLVATVDINIGVSGGSH